MLYEARLTLCLVEAGQSLGGQPHVREGVHLQHRPTYI
jgi:hypothetical protein